MTHYRDTVRSPRIEAFSSISTWRFVRIATCKPFLFFSAFCCVCVSFSSGWLSNAIDFVEYLSSDVSECFRSKDSALFWDAQIAKDSVEGELETFPLCISLRLRCLLERRDEDFDLAVCRIGSSWWSLGCMSSRETVAGLLSFEDMVSFWYKKTSSSMHLSEGWDKGGQLCDLLPCQSKLNFEIAAVVGQHRKETVHRHITGILLNRNTKRRPI